MEERVIRLHECFNRTGGGGGVCVCVCSTVKKPSWLSAEGGGMDCRLLHGHDALTTTRVTHDKPTQVHILLAVVVHSVPSSSFTVFITVPVNALSVESLPPVSWIGRFKTFPTNVWHRRGASGA